MRHWFAIATLLLLSLPSWGQHPDSVYTKDGVALPRRAASKNIRPVYHNHFHRTDTMPGAAAPVLWVVAPSRFSSTLQPFLQWKQQTGFRIDTIYVTASHCDSIHSLLQQRYDEARLQLCAPDYVLVVGDASLIAPFPGQRRPSSELTNYYTDLYYGEYTGDFYPEAVVGRLPAADAEELQLMLDKIMAYEQLAQPADYLRRALLVAGKENLAPAPTVTNGQVHYLSQCLKTLHPEIDTVCYHNPASEHQLEPIVVHLRQGMGLVCFTAHGTIHGWHYPDYTYSIADTLGDTAAAVYINNCCYSNNFATDCFGVHLLRKPTGGAVGVIGATNSTLWEEDYLWNVGARQEYTLTPQPNVDHPGALDRHLWRQHLPLQQQAWTLGDIMHAGNYAVSEAGSIFEPYYWEIYNLLGDPTLMPLVGTPQPLSIAATAPVRRGATTLTLTGTPDSYVAVSDSDGLLGSGWTDSNGTARIALLRSIVTDNIRITASQAGHLPCSAVVATATASQPTLAVAGFERNGDSLLVTLRNVSDDTCFGHTVALQQSHDDSTGALIVATAPTLLDTVAPQAFRTIRLPLTVAATGRQPVIRFHIALADDNAVYSQMQVALPHSVTRPQLTDVWPLYQGEPAQYVTYDTPYTMAFAVDNPTDDTTLFLIGVRDSFPTYTCHIAPRQRDTLYVDIVTRPSDPMAHGSHCLPIQLRCGAWYHDTMCCLQLNGNVEDFASRDFTAWPWDNTSSMQPWRIDENISYSGGSSARSGAIGNRQTSDLAMSLYLPFIDTLTFWCRTSTEEGYDNLLFYVDNVQYDGWSGENGWSRVRYLLPAGRHRLLWRYRKDESGSRGDDCVWIDKILLPLAIWDDSYGYRGAAAIDTVGDPGQQPHLYPNPANENVVLTGIPPSNDWSATLYDICGRPLGQLQAGSNPVGHLPRGVYLVVIRTAHHSTTLKLTTQ